MCCALELKTQLKYPPARISINKPTLSIRPANIWPVEVKQFHLFVEMPGNAKCLSKNNMNYIDRISRQQNKLLSKYVLTCRVGKGVSLYIKYIVKPSGVLTTTKQVILSTFHLSYDTYLLS